MHNSPPKHARDRQIKSLGKEKNFTLWQSRERTENSRAKRIRQYPIQQKMRPKLKMDAAAVRGIFFAWGLKVAISTIKWYLPTGRDAIGNRGRAQREVFEWRKRTNNPKVVDPQNAFFFSWIMRRSIEASHSEERFKYSIIMWHSANKIPYLIAEL